MARSGRPAWLRASINSTASSGLRHDLSQTNLGTFLRGVPGVQEVSIGHALIGEALYQGLPATVAAYLKIIREASA